MLFMQKQYFIIDFDSTLVIVEALDELAKIALKSHSEKQKIAEQIMQLTSLGMEGKLSFPESLTQRLALFQANKTHIKKLIVLLKKNITPSVTKNAIFFKEKADEIFIISGGFKEYIYPVMRQFGIKEDHILANTFLFDKVGNIIGFDEKNPLAQENGKVKQIKQLGLQGLVYVIGDGFTDYTIQQQGHAKKFFAFTENIARPTVIDKTKYIAANFDEVLYSLKMPRALSYPKSKMKVLLLENIHPLAVELFEKDGYTVASYKKALSESELIEKIADVSILGIRSKTEVTQTVLAQAKKLLTIGAYCIGTNQIDLSVCSRQGVAVFNAPFSNTRSVVELALGEIIMLYRRTCDKSMKMHTGVWDKSAIGSHEIRGKKLGIIGYGNIGSQLSVLAENLGMDVYFYNTSEKLALGNAKKCSSLDELLHIADVITVHVSGKKSNTNFIGEKEFAKMKEGVLFLNLSRGFVVDINALSKNLASGKVAGAAIDVFPEEPKSNIDPFESPLQNLQNVILTPHVAGSTAEAQVAIGEFVTMKLLHFINSGNTTLSVNFPNIQLPELQNSHRFIHIHENQPGILAQINNIFAKNAINIEGQYLKTNDEIGYVISDVNKNYSNTVINELKSIEGTVRVRVLY
jgi:D-3-phosphoglycerate dehydrogenase / 2-oxoglutarate reductase